MMNMFNVINISLKSLFYCLLAILSRREFILLFLMPDMPVPPFLKAFEFMQMNYIWSIVPIIPLYCYFLIKNKTDKYIVIADNSYETEVELNLGDQKRTATNLQQTNVIIAPNSTVRVTFIFAKYADDGKNPSEVNFNDVRLFENYKIGMDPEKASGMYSFNFKIR